MILWRDAAQPMMLAHDSFTLLWGWALRLNRLGFRNRQVRSAATIQGAKSVFISIQE
ncbi:MAG TPA: hypothetical protein VFR78_15245 [Pyrinomonadaceae bacterium]|nr:hypothetical protein [Pyrinomonadaceae bacterium]